MSLFSVNTNLGALAALQSLETTQQALNETQNEVSTGQKVSSSADNPAIYSIANTINANVAGLSAVSDSLNFGAQVVSTASSAVSSVSTVLDSLQQTVTSSNTSGESLTTLQNQVTSAINSINQYASDATFSGVNLFAYQNGGDVTSNSLNVVQSVDGTVYTVSNLINPPPVGSAAATSNKTLSDALGLTSLSVLTGADSSTASATQSIGAKFSLGATGASAPTPASAFAYTSTGGDAAFTIYTGAQATGGLPGGTGDNTYTFEFVDSNSTSTALQSLPSAGTTSKGVTTGANQVIAVNIDTATQSTNQIVGALQAALTANGFGVVQNSDGSLNIVGNGLTGAAFGYVLGGAFTSSSETDTSVTGADETLNSASGNVADATSGIEVQALSTNETAVTTVQNAVQQLNTISATLGAASQQITGIQNFTSALSSALTAGVGALTDADLATESAKLTSLQTKQQLATQSLSIAEQQPQSLLTLFKNA
jgi:flagellin